SGSRRSLACSRSVSELRPLLDPVLRARPLQARGLIPYRAVCGLDLRLAVPALVVQVHHVGAMAALLAAHARILESLTQLPVGAAPAHPLVEAVGANDILPPNGRVVAIEGRPGRGDRIEYAPGRCGQAETEQRPRGRRTPGPQPAPGRRIPRQHVLGRERKSVAEGKG